MEEGVWPCFDLSKLSFSRRGCPNTLGRCQRTETQSWPYDFPLSEDFPHADQRGTVSGRLLVRDKYINEQLMTANFAFVGLAAPGNVGSWQRENKVFFVFVLLLSYIFSQQTTEYCCFRI
ncbi:uncharacterized protein LOC114264424 isoform X2 [Camellia sinensis]|uniref:uncharacterized protein LOC114264424 isoform X2 n=1 Tax=Camellia sinensis TaxID=4442 RepID=UPI0010363D0B|nr:uncharacterized protein LOC114264424 isoform X2 [Camellia sinensis]